MVKKTTEPKLQAGYATLDRGELTLLGAPGFRQARLGEAPGWPSGTVCLLSDDVTPVEALLVGSVRGSLPIAPPARPLPGLHGEVC